MPLLWKFDRTTLSRGSKSRNKVSVGEPAEGSLRSYYEKVVEGATRSSRIERPYTVGAKRESALDTKRRLD